MGDGRGGGTVVVVTGHLGGCRGWGEVEGGLCERVWRA